MRRLAALAMAVTMGAALPACGGGGDRLTATEFRKQANGICERGNKKIAAAAEAKFAHLGRNQQPDVDSPEAQEFFDLFVHNIDGQLSDIRDLNPPDDLEDDVDEMLDTLEEELKGVEDEGPQILLAENNPFAASQSKAGDLGLTACAG